MGLNGAALAVLLKDFDPSRIGAYIDPAHLVVNGEDFDFALAMLKDRLALVALKDVLLTREEKGGHGTVKIHWVEAGHGMVDWSAVFAELRRIKYDGIFSVHCEFEVPEEEFLRIVVKEVRFFRKFVGSPA
jgi:sugar phosphate isomerase/epimerase